MTDMNAPPAMTDQQKKLLFRAWHRGTREADLLMGRFAEDFLPTASVQEVDLFEELLAENDPDIYDWITGKESLPDKAFTPLLKHFMDFYQTAS